MIKVAILGCGVVGGGVYDVIEANRELITKQAGCEIEVKYILDIRDFKGTPYEGLVVGDIDTIVNDPEISIVAETMGGAHPAYDYSLKAIRAGKHVVTSNKLVVASFGTELLEEARKNGVRYLFEASVGGGIPIIRPMLESLAGNGIDEVCGILNGTTNYILSKMKNEGLSFDVALRQAQDAGYAERDPSADIEGYDSCRKICILAGIAYGALPEPEAVRTMGITKLSDRDIADAAKLGCSVKLIGQAAKVDGRLDIAVEPCFVPKANPLSTIEDVYNGILVRGNALGDVMFYGMGAGKLPTASAVLSDIIDCARNGAGGAMAEWTQGGEYADGKLAQCEYYIRLTEKLYADAVSEEGGEYAYVTRGTRSALEAAHPAAKAIIKIL